MRTLVLLAIVPTILAAAPGRIERVNFDLGAPSRQIAISATEGLDTSIEASIRRDGALFDARDWTVLLWYGTASTNPPIGLAFTNAASGRGWARWDIDGSMLATNGRFAVQIVASHPDGTIQDWASGYMTIRADSTSTFQPVTFGAPLHAVSNALAAAIAVASTNLQGAITAEAQARAAGDLVSMTNWQAVVYSMTNGAALGETALQPFWATTGMVAHAATAGSAMTATMLSAADGADVWLSWDGTAWVWHWVNDSSNVWVTAYTGAGYDGPPVGARWFFASDNGDTTVYTNTANAPFNEVWREIGSGVWNIREDGYSYTGNNGFDMGLPATIEKVIPDYNMTVTLDWLPQTNSTTFTTHADIAGATNALVQTYFLTTNAWMSISNQTLTIWRETNGVPAALWSSAESEGGGGVDPAFTNAVWDALTAKADAAWGKYAPDGSANPDPAYMTYLNAPATMHASGYQWATYGAYSVMAESGAVAYESGADGTARWGLDLLTNYVGFVRGGSIIVAAKAESINVIGGGTETGYAEILYPYTAGDFPALWHAPALDVPFTLQEGVVWVDNQDGTATVTAPATTPKGFWYATTTSTYDVMFDIRPPARLTGGVIGQTNVPPVVYDAVITVTSGSKTYRIPAQEVIP